MCPEKMVMRAGIIMLRSCFRELTWRKLVKVQNVGSLSEVKTHRYASTAHLLLQASLTSATCRLFQQLLYLQSYQSCALAAVEIRML